MAPLRFVAFSLAFFVSLASASHIRSCQQHEKDQLSKKFEHCLVEGFAKVDLEQDFCDEAKHMINRCSAVFDQCFVKAHNEIGFNQLTKSWMGALAKSAQDLTDRLSDCNFKVVGKSNAKSFSNDIKVMSMSEVFCIKPSDCLDCKMNETLNGDVLNRTWDGKIVKEELCATINQTIIDCTEEIRTCNKFIDEDSVKTELQFMVLWEDRFAEYRQCDMFDGWTPNSAARPESLAAAFLSIVASFLLSKLAN